MNQPPRRGTGFGSASSPIRIVIADDHAVVRMGVKSILSNDPGYQVIGEAEDGDDAITQTLETEPDVLLLDLAMPRLPGLEAMRAIVGRSSGVKIILLTGSITTQQIIEALQIGARGIVEKGSVAGELTKALRAVQSGDYWIGGARVAPHGAQHPELTPPSSPNSVSSPPRPPPARSARPTASRRASWRLSTRSSRAAPTRTLPRPSPSPRRP